MSVSEAAGDPCVHILLCGPQEILKLFADRSKTTQTRLEQYDGAAMLFQGNPHPADHDNCRF